MRNSFHTPFPSPGARKRLLVFHHAGGSGLSFLRLAKQLCPEVELYLAELPGRGRSHLAPPVNSIREFAEACAEEIQTGNFSPPLELYGHSLGATIAFEVAILLPGKFERLVVSSSLAPSCPQGPSGQGELSTAELNSILDRYGGLAESSSVAREYVLPFLKSDLELLRAYSPHLGQIDVPILAIGGAKDEIVGEGDLRKWALHTAKGFELSVVNGGHFFMWDNPLALSHIF